jgi:hypothetical protein
MQPLQKYATASFLTFASGQEKTPPCIRQIAQDFKGALSDERSNKARAALKKALKHVEEEGSSEACLLLPCLPGTER